MIVTGGGEAGGGCPSAYAAAGANWCVLHIVQIYSTGVAPYNIQITIIGDRSVSVTSSGEAGGDRPAAYGAVGVNYGILDIILISTTALESPHNI